MLIDASDSTIAGHGRVEAAKLEGFTTVPTVRLDHLTPSQIRKFIIADNRLAELAGWDSEVLADEISGLLELNIDFEPIGFEPGEIDALPERFWRALSRTRRSRCSRTRVLRLSARRGLDPRQASKSVVEMLAREMITSA